VRKGKGGNGEGKIIDITTTISGKRGITVKGEIHWKRGRGEKKNNTKGGRKNIEGKKTGRRAPLKSTV